MEAQMRKTQSRPMHCNIADKYYLSIYAYDESGDSFKDLLESLPCVKRVGKSYGVPGSIRVGQYSTTRDGQDILYRHIRMDSTAFAMFGFEILEDYSAPLFNSVWFSDESFAASGFDSEYHDIGTLSRRTQGCDQLAGVFKAFPTNSANMGKDDYAIISVMRTEDISSNSWVIETTGDRKEAARQITDTYETYAKEHKVIDFDAFWVDEHIAQAWKPARNNMRLVEIFMLLSILIALLGLVAMSTYYSDIHSNEIAIRKVFGGTVGSESLRSIREYMILVGIACVIGIPIAVWAAGIYLEQFIWKLENYWWIFVVSVILSVMIALISVIWQVIRSARTNPAEALKKE